MPPSQGLKEINDKLNYIIDLVKDLLTVEKTPLLKEVDEPSRKAKSNS